MDITKLSDLDLASLILPEVQKRDIANENLRVIAAEMERRRQVLPQKEPVVLPELKETQAE